MSFVKIVQLGLKRFRSPEDYSAMQAYLANVTIVDLARRGISLHDKRVLELAAHRGAYTVELKKDSKEVVASDLEKHEDFPSDIQHHVWDVQQSPPAELHSFDFVYCASTIEHVSNPTAMIKNIHDVLSDDGILFLTFPPFYSLFLVGGHMFKPWHFFGERIAVRLYNLTHKKKIDNYATCFGEFGLHPLTIKDVKKMLEESGFRVDDQFTRGFFHRSAKLPGFLKDLFTWHVCFVAVKSD